MNTNPVDNFGTVVGENPTPYGILALWAVNGLSRTGHRIGVNLPIGKVLILVLAEKCPLGMGRYHGIP